MEQKTTKQQLKNKFGKIYMNVLTNKSLNRTDKLTYAVISCKQGSTGSAHLTAIQIADALSADEKTVRRSIKKLKSEGIVTKRKAGRWTINHPTGETEHFGLVELCVLASQKLHRNSKLLFMYYRAASSTYGYCSRSRETILKDLGIGNKTYNDAKKDLSERGLIKVETRKAYGMQFTNKVVTTIIPENVEKEMTWPESWNQSDEKHEEKTELQVITKQQALSALGTIPDNSAPQHRTNEHMQKGQSEPTNKNLFKNPNNNNTSLVAYNTTGSIDPVDDLTEIKTETFSPKIFVKGFKVDELDIDHEKIKMVFLKIRRIAGRFEWRINIEDYFRLSCFVLDHYNPETFEEVVEYIAKNRPNATTLSYFLSIIQINTTIEGLEGQTEEYRDRFCRAENKALKDEFDEENKIYKATRLANNLKIIENGNTMAPTTYEVKKTIPTEKKNPISRKNRWQGVHGEIEDIIGI